MHQNYKINLSPSQYHDAMKKLTFYKTTRRYEPVDLFRDSEYRIMYKISLGLLGITSQHRAG